MHPDAIPDFSHRGPHGVTPGAGPARGCTIFAHLLADRLDGFLIQSLYAAAVRRCFDHPRLFVFCRKDQPRHQAVPLMLPDITFTWRGGGKESIPMDFFDFSKGAAIRSGNAEWHQLGCDAPDIMLVPSMMDWRHLGAFERAPRLDLPRDRVPEINQAFRGLGVDPNWWFCALAVPDHDAGADLVRFNSALSAIDRVITKQYAAGLVLVGDPETPLDQVPPGVFDARQLPQGVLGQAYVISKARFLVEPIPSPWLWLAFGLDVPWLRRTNSAAPDKLPGRGFLYPADLDDTPAHAAAVEAMIGETLDCPMWRSGRADDPGPAANLVHLPMHAGPDARVITL